MRDSEPSDIPPKQLKLVELVGKIQAYQRQLGNDKPVELDELKREGVLDAVDLEFLRSHSITYKPHRVSDYHAIDMFHMPSASGSCVFTGPSGPKLKKRRAPLRNLQGIIESFLRLPRPKEELLFHIELSEQDGMSVSPELIGLALQSASWQERLPSIRAVGAELGFRPFQDEMVQGTHVLTYLTAADAQETATAAVGLLSRGCGFADGAKIVYSAGALDGIQTAWPKRIILYLILFPVLLIISLRFYAQFRHVDVFVSRVAPMPEQLATNLHMVEHKISPTVRIESPYEKAEQRILLPQEIRRLRRSIAWSATMSPFIDSLTILNATNVLARQVGKHYIREYELNKRGNRWVIVNATRSHIDRYAPN